MPEPRPVVLRNEEVERLCDDGVLRLWKFWCPKTDTLTWNPVCGADGVTHKAVLVLEDGFEVIPPRPSQRAGGEGGGADDG